MFKVTWTSDDGTSVVEYADTAPELGTEEDYIVETAHTRVVSAVVAVEEVDDAPVELPPAPPVDETPPETVEPVVTVEPTVEPVVGPPTPPVA